MRGGRFLAEESPSALLHKHSCESLENVFLKLSIIQNKGKRRRSSILLEVTAAATAAMPVSLSLYRCYLKSLLIYILLHIHEWCQWFKC